MFKPSLSESHRSAVVNLNSQLVRAIENSKAATHPELASSEARLLEVENKISELKRGANLGNLEERAYEISSLQIQAELLRGQIGEMKQGQESEQAKADHVLANTCRQTVLLLSEVASDFRRQHQEHLVGVIDNYAQGGRARQLIALIPWFAAYANRIQHFSLGNVTASADKLLAYLKDALEGIDFLTVDWK